MHPLLKAFNKQIGSIRFKVEQAFGTMKRRFHLGRARYFGTAKVQAPMCWAALGMNLLKAHRKLKAMESEGVVHPEGRSEALKPSGAHDPRHGFDKQAVVRTAASRITRLAKAVRLHQEPLNDLFEGELIDDDKLIHLNNVIKGKLMESEVLAKQTRNNTKAQFAASPNFDSELMDALIAAFEVHQVMSRQALDSEKVRAGIKNILLGPAGLYEGLR